MVGTSNLHRFLNWPLTWGGYFYLADSQNRIAMAIAGITGDFHGIRHQKLIGWLSTDVHEGPKL